MSLFWPGTSTQTVHRNYIDSNINSQKTEYMGDSISGRLSIDWQYYGRGYDGKGHSNISFPKPRISDKYPKILVESSSTDRVSGSPNRLLQNGVDFAITVEKIKLQCQELVKQTEVSSLLQYIIGNFKKIR